MNKRFKPDFDHLLETAYIVEGHGCHGAAHGCCCRGCSECEENYKHENYESGVGESENYESEMKKIILYTDPSYFGAEPGNYKPSGASINISTDKLVGFEPDKKMDQPASAKKLANIVSSIEKGDKLPPVWVRKYKNGYQVIDGHHRFWGHKKAGKKEISAIVIPDTDIEVRDKVSENFADGKNKSENWEAGTSKAPKGKSYDMSRGGAPSNVDAKKDGPGGRYRRTRPPSAPSNKTHSEMEESGEPGLREIIDSLGKPNTNVPYGDDPEADSPEYNENNELANISDVVGAVMNLPTEKELKEKGGGILGIGRDPVIKKALDVRRKAVKALDNELRDIESRL